MSWPEQLALDLFPPDRHETKGPLGLFLEWAHGTHGCGPAIDPIAEEVFAKMPEPFDRCKALVTVFRAGRDGSQFVPLLGLFEEQDYHVCWDRAYGAVHDVPIELVSRIERCDYNTCAPHFYDGDGGLVFTVRTWLADRYEERNKR